METEEKPKVYYPEIRQVVETMYAIQNLRIQAGNRVGAYERLGMNPDSVKTMHKWVDDKLAGFEDDLRDQVAKAVGDFVIYKTWMKRVKGIGPALSGSLLAGIGDISRFANISKLWRYCGQAVIDGAAERRKIGEKIHYSPFMKTACYKIGKQFVMQGDYYRKVYDEAKGKLREQHPIPVDTGKKNKENKPIMHYSDGHIDAMARRKTVKMFLADLWLAWRAQEGLSVSKPYAIDIMGHSGFREPEFP